MKVKRFTKKGVSILLAIALIISLGLAATATSSGDYPTGIYSATARVDESVGLRADATIGYGTTLARGIIPTDTRAYGTRTSTSGSAALGEVDVSAVDDLDVAVTPYAGYGVTNIVVSAIAEITRADGTMEAVKDVQKFTGVTSASYAIPDFTSYVKSNDRKIEVEIVVYADLIYTTAAVDCTIDLNTGDVTPSTTAGVTCSGTLFTIDTNLAFGKTVKIVGQSTNAYQLRVYNSTKGANRNIHLIFDGVKMYGPGADHSNYQTVSNTLFPISFSTNVSNAGQLRTSSATVNTYAPVALADVDAYVTFTNENILAQAYTEANGGSPNASAIMVDASASLIVTDASMGSLYARGGGCSAAIGSSYTYPSGYVEIDGGTITATSAHNSHAYAGIGNGGHYSSTDPGTRGIVINGGKVEAMGFHYGIGANGGTSSTIDSNIGPQYLIITGGKVVSEASAGSAGASIGFAYNNARHDVRIGRPDKIDSDTTVTSVNWGYGAAISGKMTFYSGTTSAYSGQYSAAIGGNAVSNATTSAATPSAAQTAGSAVSGTPLTVYGGNVTAEAGAFLQGVYSEYTTAAGSSNIRGINLNRSSAASVLTESRPPASYGAAIGGANGQAGGTENKIFAGTFDVLSSVYGAGIGGGGGYGTLVGGAGGNTWIGNLTDLALSGVQDMDFTITADNAGYGAGFGGGGSYAANGGAGGNVYIGGGEFEIYGSVYGAGFGGGGSYAANGGAGGDTVVINDGEFTVYSGLYGAGIGGGGSNGGNGGNGGSATGSFTINGGDFKAETGYAYTRSALHAPSTVAAVALNSPSYGAGIGGGGSGGTGIGGNGSTKFVATGGRFNSVSNGYGAGIGGGGSYSGTAGTGGTARYEGGTVEVSVPLDSAGDPEYGSVGMGGGAAATGTGGNTTAGNVTIIGGNIYTEITSLAGTGVGQHAWTCPDPATNATSTAIKIEVDESEIDKLVEEVAYLYNGHWYFDYGTNDTWVTEGVNDQGQKIGVVWVWVPTDYELSYDLTSGRPASAYTSNVSNSNPNDFDIGDATRGAVGYTYLTMDTTGNIYNFPGEKRALLGWNELIESSLSYGNAYWSNVHPSADYHDAPGNRLYNLTEHDPDGTTNIYLIGWTEQIGGVIDPGNGQEHIFALNDGWDYTQYVTDSVSVTNSSKTVYAVWGYDNNGNNVPDVREVGLSLTYMANGGSGAPHHTMTYSYGTAAGISNTVPTNPGHVFMGWTKDISYPSFNLTSTLSGLPSDIYMYNGGILLANGTILQGNPAVTFDMAADIVLHALWADDANGNNVPDFLETTRYLIHEGNGATSGSVPGNIAYVDGLTGISDSGAGMTHSTSANIFLGWTEDQNAVSPLTKNHTSADLPGDLADPIILAAPFSGSNKTVYAVWAEDTNGNLIADFLESRLSFVYDTQTTDTVTGVPVDSTVYYEYDYVNDILNDPELSAATTTMDPYMQRNGWALLGWVDTPVQADNMTVPAHTYLPTVAGASFQFSNTDITIYAVWGIDSNGNGVPDWDEVDGRTVRYIPSLGATYLDEATVPFFDAMTADVYVDPGPGSGSSFVNYASKETAALSSQTPKATNDDYVFLGWSPVYIGGAIFGQSTNLNLDDFQNLLTLLNDISNGTNYSGHNDISFMGIPGGPTTGVTFAQAKYTVEPGLESIFADIASGTSVHDAFAGYNWVSNNIQSFSGEGFLTSVTFDAFNVNKSDLSGDPECATWNMYGIWGEDLNGNGIADIFEDPYSLLYVKDVSNPTYTPASGGPNNEYLKYYPGKSARVSSIVPTKVDSNFNNMFFLGWTTDANVQECYGTGEAALVPQLVGGVTFGNFDITLYAVWAIDSDGDGIPDVYEGGFTLTYDANGGAGAPVDSTIYQYKDEITPVDGTTIPTLTNGNHIFLFWTDDDGLAPLYSRGDRANLPEEITAVKFTNSNITLYAVWGEDDNGNGVPDVHEDDFQLSYDANGGINAPTDSTAYNLGDTATLDGGTGMSYGSYLFVGWTTEDPSTYNSVYTYGESALLPNIVGDVTFTSKDITVYAVWSTDYNGNGDPDVYETVGTVTVTYDANGGTGSQTDANSPYSLNDVVTVLDENDMARTGYIFDGWNTEPDGSGTAYVSGDQFDITEDTVLYAQWTPEGTVDEFTVTYDANGGTGSHSVTGITDGDIHTVLDPANIGISRGTPFKFTGWNTASDGSGTAYAIGDTFAVTGDTVLYAQWRECGVNDDDHIAYIYGYPDGSVQPGGSITRAEAASIFFRLLDPALHFDKNDPVADQFSDVNSNEWYAQAVNYLATIGILEGYENGGFRPGATITRAEFATIAARFDSLVYTGTSVFTDVPDSHWAVEYINSAYAKGWVSGYGDGTFRPGQSITRAEVVTLVNAMLNRAIDAAALAQVANPFNDIDGTHWAYAEIMEAAFDHDYVRDSNGVESWTNW